MWSGVLITVPTKDQSGLRSVHCEDTVSENKKAKQSIQENVEKVSGTVTHMEKKISENMAAVSSECNHGKDKSVATEKDTNARNISDCGLDVKLEMPVSDIGGDRTDPTSKEEPIASDMKCSSRNVSECVPEIKEEVPLVLNAKPHTDVTVSEVPKEVAGPSPLKISSQLKAQFRQKLKKSPKLKSHFPTSQSMDGEPEQGKNCRTEANIQPTFSAGYEDCAEQTSALPDIKALKSAEVVRSKRNFGNVDTSDKVSNCEVLKAETKADDAQSNDVEMEIEELQELDALCDRNGTAHLEGGEQKVSGNEEEMDINQVKEMSTFSMSEEEASEDSLLVKSELKNISKLTDSVEKCIEDLNITAVDKSQQHKTSGSSYFGINRSPDISLLEDLNFNLEGRSEGQHSDQKGKVAWEMANEKLLEDIDFQLDSVEDQSIPVEESVEREMERMTQNETRLTSNGGDDLPHGCINILPSASIPLESIEWQDNMKTEVDSDGELQGIDGKYGTGQWEPLHEDDSESDDDLVSISVLNRASHADSPAYNSTTSKLTLDELLADSKEREKNKKDDLNMQEIMKEGFLNRGDGKLHDEEYDEEDLMPEHREQLQQLAISEQTVVDSPPGEQVFNPQCYKCLFNQDTLTLASCGFTADSESPVDKLLTTLPANSVADVLQSDVITLCFDAISCPHAFLTWLFQLLSIHQDPMTVLGIQKIFHQVISREDERASSWIPSVRDMVKILVNYGGEINDICPWSSIIERHQLNDFRMQEGIEAPNPVLQGCFQVANLQCVVRVLTQVIVNRFRMFCEDDLFTFALLIMKAAMDIKSLEEVFEVDVKTSLSAILNAFSEVAWKRKVIEFCDVIPSMMDHHHNKQHIVSLLPPVDRGIYLQRRVAYVTLRQILGQKVDLDTVHDFKLSRVVALMSLIEVKEDVDLYKANTSLKLVSYCVGNENPVPTERENLRVLQQSVRLMMKDVRDSVTKLDRVLLKDRMVRLHSKWEFMLKAAEKQKTLFAYAPTTTMVQEIRSETCGSDVQCEDDSEIDLPDL